MQLHQLAFQLQIALFALGRLVLQPAIIAAARNFQCPAYLLQRGFLTAQRLGAAELFLYGFDRMPTDFLGYQ